MDTKDINVEYPPTVSPGGNPPQYAPPVQQVGQPGTTVVVVQQPGAGGGGYQALPEPTAMWSTTVCGCFDDMAVCCFGLFCNPCQRCQVAGLLNESACFAYCCPEFALPMMRTKLRLKYGIQGTLAGDFCTMMWCGACALCQMKRQLTSMGVN